jgi:adenylate cyclase
MNAAGTTLAPAMDPRAKPDAPAPTVLALGRCTLDLAAGELRDAAGELAGLRKQALDLLLVLGRRAGRVVGKDELMDAVWPRTVVGEGSLTQAIADIRRVLGDDEHRLVRNVARRGYMLVAAPATPEQAAAGGATAAPPAGPPAGTAAAGAAAGRPWRAAWLGAFVALALLGAAAVWWALRSAAPGWASPADLARAPLAREIPALSIIVLPLAIEGGTPDAEWLADALHGDLVTSVARQHNSLVIARDTAATYTGRPVDPRQVAREMGVRHVVRGSLRQEGTTIHLNLALIDGEAGVQRWADTFSTERAQLAQAVGDFAVAIERTLTPALYRTTVERRAALSPTEVSADDLAMQGVAMWYRGVSRENVLAARALFEQALALDPHSARAWAGIQYTTINQLLNGWAEDRAATARRHDEAVTNLERVEPEGTYTYSGKTARLFLQRDFPALLRVTAEWVERYRLPTAYGGHGVALIFNGRFDDAVPVLERALRMGPRDPFRAEWQYRLALAHFGAGRYELARDWSFSAANTNARLLWPPIHAAALLRLGDRAAAQQAFDEHMRRHPAFGAVHVRNRMPSEVPAYVEMRTRLVSSLAELGMRE